MTLFGVDGSKWNTNQPTEADWASIDFLLWRASIGRTVDLTYWPWREKARVHDKPFCAYHFVWQLTQQPGTTAAGIPAVEQAATFALAEPDRTVPVMLDWEQSTFTRDGVQLISSAATFDHVVEVAEQLRGLGYRVPLLYSGKWYWDSHGTPDLTGQGMQLVNSNYGTGNNTATGFDRDTRYAQLGGDTSVRWGITYGGLFPSMWQFSDRVTWGGSADDMNAIRDPSVVAYCFKDWTPPMSTGDLYPYQWAGAMRTMEQLEATETVRKLNPEFWRRFKAFMLHAKDEGVAVGVGVGWRVQPDPPPPGFAAPGNSNHEGFPADGVSGGAVAIDMVPAEAWEWMEPELAAYGLRSFAAVNDEPWHIQPAEIPASRSYEDRDGDGRKDPRVEPWLLEPFPLPGDQPPLEEPVTAEEIKAIVDGVWARQFTTAPETTKPAGWILAQTYALTQRSVKAAEKPLTDAEIARIATAVAAQVAGGATPEVIAVAVADEIARRTVE